MSFIPTFLFVKQHSVTGLKYFGKTYAYNPYYYHGSGREWKRHLAKYGREHVKTLWCQVFFDELTLTEFAKNFSQQNNIVDSKEWANRAEETGLTGTKGYKWTTDSRTKLSNAKKGYRHLPDSYKLGAMKNSKPCTVDGKTIYPRVVDLIAELGQGKCGRRHPNFRYVEKSE